MSNNNEVSLWESAALPAHLQNREREVSEFDTMGGVSLPKLKVKVNGIQIVEGENVIMSAPIGSMIDVVVVGASPVSRSYYPNAYVKGSNDLPTCRSYDGKRPDADVEAPQSSRCDTCPMNVAGSSGERAGGKACRYRQNLAVFIPTNPDMLLRLGMASTSIFSGRKDATPLPERFFTFNPYITKLRNHPSKLQPYDVITTLMHNPNAEQVQTVFTFSNYISAELYEKVQEHRKNTDMLDIIYGRHDKGVIEDTAPTSAEVDPMFGDAPAPAPKVAPVQKVAPVAKPSAPQNLGYIPYEPLTVEPNGTTYWREVVGSIPVGGVVVQAVIEVPANQYLPNDDWEEVDQADKVAYDNAVKQASKTNARRTRAPVEQTQVNNNAESARVVTQNSGTQVTNELANMLGDDNDE